MTAAERLVRNLCEAKRQQIEAKLRDELKQAEKLSDGRAVRGLPANVRKAVANYVLSHRMERDAKKVIEDAGFSVPYDGHRGIAVLSYRSSVRTATKEKAKAGAQVRLDKLARLRTDATIDTIGKSPTQVRERLERLRRDVAKV